jgi:hypothetical protein
MGAAGFNIHRLFPHNLVGALGWAWAGKICGRRTLRPSDTKTFDKLVPFLKVIDPVLTIPAGGVSLIAIASPAEVRDVGLKEPANSTVVSSKQTVGA